MRSKAMKLRTLSISFLILLFVLSMSVGCAKFTTTGKMMDNIEKKAFAGMSEEEFQKSVRNARIIKEEGSKKVYLLAFGEPCFVCGSAEAFLRSFEPYATKFIFINGILSSTERVIDGKY